MSDAVIIALISSGFGFLGNWVINNKNLAVVQEKISELEKKQDKHNNLVQRVYELQKDLGIAQEKIEENAEAIDKLQGKVI